MAFCFILSCELYNSQQRFQELFFRLLARAYIFILFCLYYTRRLNLCEVFPFVDVVFFMFGEHLLLPMKSQFARNKSKKNPFFFNAYITTERSARNPSRGSVSCSAKHYTHTTSIVRRAALPVEMRLVRTTTNPFERPTNHASSAGIPPLMSDVTRNPSFLEPEEVPRIDNIRSVLCLV